MLPPLMVLSKELSNMIFDNQNLDTMGENARNLFEEKYNLKSLNELEDFIKENKHLPNVPSESQVIEHGFSINEMAKIQMEKIEELTLYTIQQQKLIDQLIKEVEELKKK